MTLSRQEVETRITTALNNLLSRDRYLLETGLSERCLAHRLAIYLEDVFDDWDVDCEYNRNGNWPKGVSGVHLTNECIDTLKKTDRVLPDIIVHKRGSDGPNLLAVEMKIAGRSGRECDIQKIRGYISQLHYDYGLYACMDKNAVQEQILFPEPTEATE